MVTTLKLVLEESEYRALLEISVKDLRNPNDQAHHIIRQELLKLGFLPVDKTKIVVDANRVDQQRKEEAATYRTLDIDTQENIDYRQKE